MSTTLLARVPRITGGAGSRSQAGPLAEALVSRGAPVLLVADPGLASTSLVEDVAASLTACGLGVSVFSEFGGDPSIAATDAAAALARSIGVEAVVSLGGGSALDLGKAAAAIATAAEPAGAYELALRPLPERRLASICIPTTSGTGSEVTRTSVLSRADKTKIWLWGDTIKPDEVILDPEATVSLPPGLTAATGIDALVHAIEAATNNRAQPVVDVFALEAIRLVAQHIEAAVADGRSLAAREALQRAATFAGIAIDNCGTAVAHTIGHAMASLRPIHHGRSVALGMIATLAWNAEVDEGRFGAVAEAMGIDSASGLPAAFDALARRTGIKVSVADEFSGVTPAALAAQMGAPENAPMRNANNRKVTDEDLLVFAGRVLTQS